MLSAFWNDMKIAARGLARARGFAAAVVGTLAAATALQTSAIAVVNAYVLRSLPYPGAERLYNVSYAERPQNPPSGLAALDWSSLADVVEHPIAWDLDVFYLLGGEYPESAPGAWVTPGFMRGLGIPAAIGRSFTADDFEAGRPQVALISHGLWRGRFGGDSAAIGRAFNAYVSDRPNDPETFTIVGVLPENFWHMNPYTQVLTPLRAATYPYMVSLRAAVPPAVAERRIEMLVRSGGGGLSVPENWRVQLRPTHAEYVRTTKPMLVAVGVAVGLVFFIACANVALLMVLRGMRRRREIAVRLALGAGVGRVARLLLAESLILVGGATALGVALASLLLRAFAGNIELQLGRRVPGGVAAMSADWTVLAIVGASGLLVAVALSLAPLVATKSVFTALRARVGGAEIGGRRTRSALIALEVAGSMALLAGCGLLVRSVVRLLDVDMGLRTRGVISTTFTMREQSYPDAAGRVALFERILAAVREADGIASVALSYPPPLVAYQPREIRTGGASGGASVTRMSVRNVTSGFFDLFGIPVLRGRAFADADRASGEPVAIVSASAARRLWPDGDALGRAIRLVEDVPASDDTIVVTRTIVGVAGDIRQTPMDEDLADVYVPMLQSPERFAAILARTSGARPSRPPSWLDALQRTVRSVDPEIAVGTLRNLDAAVAEQLARPRFLAALFSAFGVFAATLGVMGLYAVIAFAVKQREHEIAVRMAVGAEARQIVMLFLRDGSYVVLAGLVLGVLAAIAMGRLLQSQLFGVNSADALTLGVTSLLLATASLAAIWWPSLRATRISPAAVLKAD